MSTTEKKKQRHSSMFIRLLLLLVQASAVTQEEVASVSRDLIALFPTNNNDRTMILGGLVRLAFHDAGTFDKYDPTSGRSDGCVDLSSADNAGLEMLIDLLAPVVTSHPEMSRADVWNLASNLAIRASLPNGVTLDIPLRYGRSDALDAKSSCSVTDANKLPSAELSHQHTTDVFVERMGFTQREVTALMGAHTLGRADASASGYDGTVSTKMYSILICFYKH